MALMLHFASEWYGPRSFREKMCAFESKSDIRYGNANLSSAIMLLERWTLRLPSGPISVAPHVRT